MKNLKFLTKSTIAHRGLFNNKDVPENSIKAFELAIKNNYIIELDVHMIKDGNLVVFHDYNLKRMTNIDKQIEDFDYEELLKIKLLNTKYTIPTLKEVLKLINNKVPVIIELKTEKINFKLEKRVVEYLDKYKGKFAVKSFNPFSIYWFKKNRENYIRGLLVSNKKDSLKKYLLSKMVFLKFCDPDFISCKYKLYNNKKIIKFKKNNIVIGWTIKSEESFNKYIKYFDNLICENINGNKLWEKIE